MMIKDLSQVVLITNEVIVLTFLQYQRLQLLEDTL